MSSILNTIKAGEDSYNEFKNASFHNKSLDKEIVAFSNMKSGSIWIGVEDKETISGIEDKKIKYSCSTSEHFSLTTMFTH